MDKVKQMVAAGVSIPTAIREALGASLSDVADRRGVDRVRLSEAINGIRRPTAQVAAALVAELGGTEFEWRELLWLAAKPEPPAASRAA